MNLRRLINPFAGVRRRNPKEPTMADDKTPATPAGDTGASTTPSIDVEAITKAAVQAATQAMAPVVQGLTDQVKALQGQVQQAATPESVAKAVAEQMQAQSADQEKKAARQQYITSKMKDVPDAYLSSLGDDPEKFEENEQKIRAALKGDLEKLGVKVPNVGGDATPDGKGDASGSGGGKVADAIDTSKLSGVELIGMGVKQSAATPTAPDAGKGAADASAATTDTGSTDTAQ